MSFATRILLIAMGAFVVIGVVLVGTTIGDCASLPPSQCNSAKQASFQHDAPFGLALYAVAVAFVWRWPRVLRWPRR